LRIVWPGVARVALRVGTVAPILPR